MSLLTLERVTKRFDRTLAVDDLSFSVAPATVFGFLGGNGAGKTTSLRMVLDIIRPTSGRIEVLGRAPGRANAPEIGFLPEERGLYRQMTALDTIAYFGRLKGMSASDAKRGGAALLDRFGLAANSKMTVDKLSKGMAQKVQLATALVNRPRLLILDEPFSGLDPVNQGLLEEEIRRMSAAGSTVVFSTHVMQHAERLCDRLLLLARGRKKFEGTLDEARAELPARISVIAKQDPAKLAGVEAAEDRGEAEGGWRRWNVRLAAGSGAGRCSRALRRRAIPASSIRANAGEPARRVRPHRRLGGGVQVKNILLVAAREFRQIAGMRSFWLTLADHPALDGHRRPCAAADRQGRAGAGDGDRPDRRRRGPGHRAAHQAGRGSRPRSATSPATSSGTISKMPTGPRCGRSTTAGTATPTSRNSTPRAGWMPPRRRLRA